MKIDRPRARIAVAAVFTACTGCSAATPVITVFKTQTCRCCSKWVDIVRQEGFDVEVVEQADLSPVKIEHQIPAELHSCHTAITGAYVFEGHVPIDLVREVLKEQPRIRGLAVPGMPLGSPGMEIPGRKDPYNVVAFDESGKQFVFAQR